MGIQIKIYDDHTQRATVVITRSYFAAPSGEGMLFEQTCLACSNCGGMVRPRRRELIGPGDEKKTVERTWFFRALPHPIRVCITGAPASRAHLRRLETLPPESLWGRWLRFNPWHGWEPAE